MKQMDPEQLAGELAFYIEKAELDVSTGPALADVMEVYQERCSTLVELVSEIRYFYEDFTEYDAKQAKKQFKGGAVHVLEALKTKYAALDNWVAEDIHAAVEQTVEELEVGFGKVGQPLRLAITGHGRSPSIDITLQLLGKNKTLERLDQAINFIG